MNKSVKEWFDKLKFNYQLLFHVGDIEPPKGMTKEEREKFVSSIFRKKAKLHEKLGAKKFEKFIIAFDKAKFRFLKNVIGEERFLKWYDWKETFKTKLRLRKTEKEDERQELLYNLERNKIAVRKALKEEKSPNYFLGVDNRVENFGGHILLNKRIHQRSLALNGIILSTCVGLGLLGAPIVPITLLGAYQIPAAFKNMQCINAQEYVLSRMNANQKAILRRNYRGITKQYENRSTLYDALAKAKEKGIDVFDIGALIPELSPEARKEYLEFINAERERRAAERSTTSPAVNSIPEQQPTREQQPTIEPQPTREQELLAERIVEEMASNPSAEISHQPIKTIRR